MLHLKDATIQDLSSILLKATNTDIVGICAFLLYKTSKHLCLLSIHKVHASLGPKHCRDFPFSFFQLLTGRDTTTAFIGFGKVSVWKVLGDFLNKFTKFSLKFSFRTSIDELTENDIQLVKYFVSSLYLGLKNFTTLEINESRKKMILPKTDSFDKLPPTKSVMCYNILRCIFQCIIWTNPFVKLPKLSKNKTALNSWKNTGEPSTTFCRCDCYN